MADDLSRDTVFDNGGAAVAPDELWALALAIHHARGIRASATTPLTRQPCRPDRRV